MNPKSPRHWLLSRHESAEAQLDAIRRQTLAEAEAASRSSPPEMARPFFHALRAYVIGAAAVAALVIVARVVIVNRPVAAPSQPAQVPVPARTAVAQPAAPVSPAANQAATAAPLLPAEPVVVVVAPGSSSGPASKAPVSGPSATTTNPFGGMTRGGAAGRGGPGVGGGGGRGSGGGGSGGGRQASSGMGPTSAPTSTLPPVSLTADPEPRRIFTTNELNIPPNPTLQVPPVYPPTLKQSGIEGSVTVSAVVDENGNVVNARVMESTDRGFEPAALDAVRKWKFRPGQRAGTAVPTVMEFPINFHLTGSK